MSETTLKKPNADELMSKFLDNVQEMTNVSETAEKAASKKMSKAELLESVKNSKFSDVGLSVEKIRGSLTGVVEAVNAEAGNAKEFLTSLTQYNAVEVEMRERADRVVVEAEAGLTTVKNAPLEWYTIKSWRLERINEAETNFERAKALKEELIKKAELMMTERIKNANFSDIQEAYTKQSDAVVKLLGDVMAKNKTQVANLKVLNQQVQQLMIESAGNKKVLEEKVKELEVKLNTALNERGDFPAGSTEAAEHEKVIGGLQQQYNIAEMAYQEELAAHISSERFVAQTIAQITGLEQTSAMINALKRGLMEDTKSRKQTFPAALQMIQAARAQEIASGASRAGIEVDEAIMKMVAKSMSAFYKDAIERTNKHPEDMKNRISILEVMQKLSNEFRDGMKKYEDILKKGYDNETPPEEEKEEEKLSDAA